jgi:hypothetical protein
LTYTDPNRLIRAGMFKSSRTNEDYKGQGRGHGDAFDQIEWMNFSPNESDCHIREYPVFEQKHSVG